MKIRVVILLSILGRIKIILSKSKEEEEKEKENAE